VDQKKGVRRVILRTLFCHYYGNYLQEPQQLSFLAESHSVAHAVAHAVAHSDFSSPAMGAKLQPAAPSPPTTTRARRNFFMWMTFLVAGGDTY